MYFDDQTQDLQRFHSIYSFKLGLCIFTPGLKKKVMPGENLSSLNELHVDII